MKLQTSIPIFSMFLLSATLADVCLSQNDEVKNPCNSEKMTPTAFDFASKKSRLPEPTAARLPLWHGFNLMEKFNAEQEKPFLEADFKMISDFGFNFVRLPMDYRVWIANGDWRSFNEHALKEIDKAVEYGIKYDIHVCINFHRAPGYTVATPSEPKVLWSDVEAQEVCALHWRAFARRYKGIPNKNLSFNLLNEPGGIGNDTYLKVVAKLVDAIRKEDPARLVIADGLQGGKIPCFDLLPLKIAQAGRGYMPLEISHYKAPWVEDCRDLPPPQWPLIQNTESMYLYGSEKQNLKSSLRIKFSKPSATPMEVYIKVGKVSDRSLLKISANGSKVFEREFAVGPGAGEWCKATYAKEWNKYQGIYERTFACGGIPAGSETLEISNEKGDWMTISALSLQWVSEDGRRISATFTPENSVWGEKHSTSISFNPVIAERCLANESPFNCDETKKDKGWLWNAYTCPWKELEAEGGGVMIGEFGCYNKTPHDVALSWMADELENWEKAGWGWALWQFRGPFGIMDSERNDVCYEDYQGHKLDRKMLLLLKKHIGGN